MQGSLLADMLLTILYLMVAHGNSEEALPTLPMFAYAGYRLMPALQTIHQGLSQMRFSEPALDPLCADLQSPPEAQAGATGIRKPVPEPPRLRNQIELRDVSYAYPRRQEPRQSSRSARSCEAPWDS